MTFSRRKVLLKMFNLKKGSAIFICIFFILSTMVGCSPPKKNAAPDPFFEKWRVMAEENRGNSPEDRERVVEVVDKEAEGLKIKEETLTEVQKKELPRSTVSLKMRNSDVTTVLRALSRAASQNILINEGVQGKISVDFDKVPWDEAFLSIMRSHTLSYVWEGDIIRIVTMQDMEQEVQMESFREKRREQEILKEKLSPLQTSVVPIDYADATKLRESLLTFLTKMDDKGNLYGSIQVNEHTNSLIIQATEADMARILPMLKEIDRPTPQIRIEANIVETTRETARNLGIQWGGNYSNFVNSKTYQVSGRSGLSGNNAAVDFPISGTTIGEMGGVGALGFLFGLGDNFLDLQLQALQADGKLNILSTPSITTLDNQTAFTENGEKVPYVTINEDGEREVKFEDAVLRLEITPHVIQAGNLKMKIIITKDEVDTSRNVQGNPFIIKKRTDTTLIVNDGETIVISGLSKTRESKGDQGIPGLKDLPILGWAFKGEGKMSNMEEVLIFITPRILTKRGAQS